VSVKINWHRSLMATSVAWKSTVHDAACTITSLADEYTRHFCISSLKYASIDRTYRDGTFVRKVYGERLPHQLANYRTLTRCLHVTAGCTTGWVNHANESSQAAFERSSQDAYD